MSSTFTTVPELQAKLDHHKRVSED